MPFVKPKLGARIISSIKLNPMTPLRVALNKSERSKEVGYLFNRDGNTSIHIKAFEEKRTELLEFFNEIVNGHMKKEHHTRKYRPHRRIQVTDNGDTLDITIKQAWCVWGKRDDIKFSCSKKELENDDMEKNGSNLFAEKIKELRDKVQHTRWDKFFNC